MDFKVKRLRQDAKLPRRSTGGSVGYDLSACMDRAVTLHPGEIEKIGTGIAIEIDSGCAALIFGRSGLGIKHGIVPANAVGVVDSDYRGEVTVGLINHSAVDYVVEPGERIAQMVLVPVFTPDVTEVDVLGESERGTGGFGSTGTK